MAEGYKQQVGARAQEVGFQVSPDAYGAGVGRAISEAGQTLHQSELRDYQIQRRATADSEATDFARRFAEYRLTMDEAVKAQRNGGAPGGAGHVDAIKGAYDKGRDSLFAGITEESVRRQAEQQFTAFGSSLLERESTWAEGARVGKVLDDFTSYRNIGANRVRGLSDQGAYQDEVKLAYSYIDGLNLDPQAKAKLQRETDQTYAVSFFNGAIDRDPVGARAILLSGKFNDVLEPQQIEQLLNGSAVEIRRADAEARTRASAVQQDVNESTDFVVKAIKDGTLADDADLAVLEQRATQAGLPPAKIYEIQDARVLNTVRREFQNAGPAVIADALRETDAAIAKAGANADPRLVQRHNHLETVLGQRRSEIENDQLGFAAKNGIIGQPIDWSAPAPDAVAERIKAVDVAAKTAGVQPQYFTKDEVASLAGQIGAGKQGALAALDAARAFGGARAVAAAKQLAPDDPVFAHLVTLSPEVAGIALAGREHLKTFPDANRPKEGDDNYHDLKDAFARQDRQVNAALESLDPKQRSAVWLTARELLAGYVAQGFGPLTPEMRMRAINNALWANGRDGQRRGGLATWGDRMFLRPSSMDSNEFTRRVQWTVAHGNGGGPVNVDGSPARLAAAYPVFVRPNVYRFDGKDGRPLRKKDGSVFTVWTGK